ncbi:MAG: iron-sulfur cluster repair di-iron protein [Ignavibacteria bacterium]|nr:iron-sulfur cluster repair di-iron protein [Ignavibacteria bacterium]
MDITKESIVGELVAQDYRTASVFKKNGIDFCCNGNRSIEEACIQKKKNSDDIISQLENVVVGTKDTAADYANWSLDLLADYIEKKHHRYVTEKIQEITPFLNKVVKVHGDSHPELFEIGQLFAEGAGELTAHMKKEELILFPVIRKLATKEPDDDMPNMPFGSIQNPINAMMSEHNNEGERYRKISELSSNYNPPLDACNTYRVTFALLKEFEEDLHEHIHLENNILFPKSIELEKSLS